MLLYRFSYGLFSFDIEWQVSNSYAQSTKGNQAIPFLNNPRYLDLSYKMELDFLGLFWKVKLCLITKEIVWQNQSTSHQSSTVFILTNLPTQADINDVSVTLKDEIFLNQEISYWPSYRSEVKCIVPSWTRSGILKSEILWLCKSCNSFQNMNPTEI